MGELTQRQDVAPDGRYVVGQLLLK